MEAGRHITPFDAYASRYDQEFSATPLGRVLRARVWSHLDAAFAPGERVLELGCGTGEDALYLASRNVQVVATDASSEMVRVAQQKASRLGLTERVDIRSLTMEAAAKVFPPNSFGGIFSNFGALNCASHLDTLVPDLARLVRPGARFIGVIMGRHVPWEWMWYLRRGRAGTAFRRYRRGGVEWRGLRVIYPTPGQLRTWLEPHFCVRRIAPLGWALPPSYAALWLNRSPRCLKALTRLEALGQNAAWLANCSDHYIVEGVKRN